VESFHGQEPSASHTALWKCCFLSHPGKKQKFTWLNGRICNLEKRISFFPFLKLFYAFLLSFITKQDVIRLFCDSNKKVISSNIRVLMIANWIHSEWSVTLLGFCCTLSIVFRTLCNFWRANKVSVSRSCSLRLVTLISCLEMHHQGTKVLILYITQTAGASKYVH
jgi:hypothetical protein